MATRKTKSKKKSKNTFQAIWGLAAKTGQFAKAFQLGSSEKTSELLKVATNFFCSEVNIKFKINLNVFKY